jgi:hypothetical protein
MSLFILEIMMDLATLTSEGWGKIENINAPTSKDNQTMWELLHAVVHYQKDVNQPNALYYKIID